MGGHLVRWMVLLQMQPGWILSSLAQLYVPLQRVNDRVEVESDIDGWVNDRVEVESDIDGWVMANDDVDMRMGEILLPIGHPLVSSCHDTPTHHSQEVRAPR
jgi:hypothetical protein